MSYTKQTWNTGDVITAQKLNHMENGIASLSGYDFVLNEGLDGFSADGLSLDEMCEKGALSLRACRYNMGHSRFEAFQTDVSESDVMFYFYTVGEEPDSIEVTEDEITTYIHGQATIYTYTYSDGHYTLTPSGGL